MIHAAGMTIAGYERKPVFGPLGMVFAMMAIGLVGLQSVGTPSVHGRSGCGYESILCRGDSSDWRANCNQDLELAGNHLGSTLCQLAGIFACSGLMRSTCLFCQ